MNLQRRGEAARCGGSHATCFKPGNPSNAVAPRCSDCRRGRRFCGLPQAGKRRGTRSISYKSPSANLCIFLRLIFTFYCCGNPLMKCCCKFINDNFLRFTGGSFYNFDFAISDRTSGYNSIRDAN